MSDDLREALRLAAAHPEDWTSVAEAAGIEGAPDPPPGRPGTDPPGEAARPVLAYAEKHGLIVARLSDDVAKVVNRPGVPPAGVAPPPSLIRTPPA